MAIEVGLSQLVTRLPPGLPTCTCSEASAPITVPSANGVMTDEIAKTVSTRRCSPAVLVPARRR
jgi:hypothetical protein